MAKIYETAKDIETFIARVSPQLDFPEVYVKDLNEQVTAWEGQEDKVKFCFTFPVEVGGIIQNLGITILYDKLNRVAGDVIAERSYYPEIKMRKRMKKRRVPLFSKETKHPLKSFDILGFSLYYPLQFLGIPECLEMANMSPIASERTEEDPIVIAGGAAVINPEPGYLFVDAFFIGDGEYGIMDMTRIYKEVRDSGSYSKEKVLLRWQKEVQGVYVPRFYEETYYATGPKKFQVKGRNTVKGYEDLPTTIKKANIEISDDLPVTKFFVSNMDGLNMGVNSVEISRSCGNKCFFCAGSYRTQPYRERKFEDVKEAFSQARKDTGYNACTPYSFNHSDYYKINELFSFLFENGFRVQMSSQRMDYFDENFAKMSKKSGTSSITFAIEAGSQKMRDKINKNLSEKQILDSFRVAFKTHYAKIKVYMISNLPDEDYDDINDIVDLAQKVREVQKEVQGDVLSTRISFSYTPFTAKAHTPLQYSKVWDCDEEGLPILAKTLNDSMEKISDIGYSVRVSTHSAVSAINQVVSLGDRRTSVALYLMWKSGTVDYKGGLSVGGDDKGMIAFRDALRDAGMEYNFYFREKDRDEKFSWDFIDMGWHRNWLKDSYFNNFKKGITIKPCMAECAGCGVCDKTQHAFFNKRRNEVTDVDIAKVMKALDFKKKEKPYRIRLKYRVDESLRFVHNSKIKMRIRRAFYRNDVPIGEQIKSCTDKHIFRDWEYGIDYAEIGLFRRVDMEGMIENLNKELEGIEILQAFQIGKRQFSNLYTDMTYGVYRIKIPRAQISTDMVEEMANKFDNEDEVLVKLKVRGEFNEGFVSKEMDIKPFVKKVWAVRREESRVVELFFMINDKLTVYDILAYFLGTIARNLYKYPVERMDFLNKSVNVKQVSFLSNYCKVCGKLVEDNVFGVSLGEYCVEHLQ